MVPYPRIPAIRSAPQKISDEFWQEVEPLIPVKVRAEGQAYRRQPGAGRKPLPARKAFEAVVYVLRTGTPWKSLPKSFGSASAIHRHFDAWHAGGFFTKLWHAGLAEHEEMEGIAWQWQKTPEREAHDDAGFVRAGATPQRQAGEHPVVQAIVRRDWQPALARRRQKKAQTQP